MTGVMSNSPSEKVGSMVRIPNSELEVQKRFMPLSQQQWQDLVLLEFHEQILNMGLQPEPAA